MVFQLPFSSEKKKKKQRKIQLDLPSAGETPEASIRNSIYSRITIKSIVPRAPNTF